MNQGQNIIKKATFSGLLLTLVFMTSVLAQMPASGLIASYPFNANADDESGNNNHANSYLVAFTIDRCGFLNTACSFNGTDNRIMLPAGSFVNLNAYTYSLWFKITDYPLPSPTEWTMISVGSSTESYQQSLSILSNGSLLGTSYNTGNDPPVTYTQTASAQTNRWNHAVLVRDNISLRIFLNGRLMENVGNNDSLTRNQPAYYGSGTYAAIIGCTSNLNKDHYFMGSLDDIMIYNRALSAEEVLQLYYSKCTLSEIEGENEVCQGQQQVSYTLYSLYGSASYQWEYSGTGAAIQDNGDNITIDFASNATSGTLTVNVTGAGVDVQTRSVSITVYSLPSGAGPIAGSNEVCSGQQGLSYSILPVQEATAYIWNYDGSGATLHGNSSSILIDFPENSTDGNLTVMGTNVCGNGPVSEAYPVVIQKLPPAAGIISGENTVCSGQQHVPYSVPAIQQATRYGWSYSGSGAVLSGNTNSIIVDFSENATSGYLTVAGQNSCGAGTRSADFFITVDPCNEKPVVNIPNSFSPNGDGINDYFVIRGLTENSTLIIFDRSGKKLAEFSNYQNDWDGKDQDGHSLESGTYWYVIFVSGIEEEFKGFVYLKR